MRKVNDINLKRLLLNDIKMSISTSVIVNDGFNNYLASFH